MKDILALIDEKELQWAYVQSSGPGGQNVNKVATAVQLRFDVAHSASLPEEARKRLARLAGRRLTQDGVLIIEAKRYRTQEKNRQDALKRLADLLQKASEKPKTRRKTKPTQASQQQRLAKKRRRSEVKRLRGESPSREEA
jgi:ribosome-associated protein